MYIRIAFSIELRLRVSRSLRSLANYVNPSNDFNNVTNHLITLYQTTALLFAAIAVYFFLRNRNRSAIGILTLAEYKGSIMEKDRSNTWSIFTDDQRDLEMAKEILKVFKAVNTHCEPQRKEPNAHLE